MTDLLERLRDENPVDPAGLDVPERLRPTAADVVASRRSGIGSRLRAGIALAIVGAVILLVVGGGRSTEQSLAARVVAIPAADAIVHWRTEAHNYVNGRDQEHTRVEGWSRRGVTHVVLSRVLRGKAHVIFDTRIAGRRSRTYQASADDYASAPAPTRHSSDPLSFGEDPLEIFRRAFRAGTLTKLGPHRYAAPLGPDTSERAIYEIDPVTARPVSLTLHTHNDAGARRYDLRFVARFAAYEQLAYTATTRRMLRLLPHPGAGPKNDPAARHFAVLRNGPRPSARQLRNLERFTDHLSHLHVDSNDARIVRPGMFLVPGKGYVCLVIQAAHGIGSGCQSIASAVRHGLGTGGVPAPGSTHRTALTVVAPDGIRTVYARVRGHKTATATVHDNLATLPGETYAWKLIK